MVNDPRLSVQMVFVKTCTCGKKIRRPTELDRQTMTIETVIGRCQACDRLLKFEVSDQPLSDATVSVKKKFLEWLSRFHEVKREAISLWPKMIKVTATELPQ